MVKGYTPRKITLGRTNTGILNGELDLTEWDEEELLRGQRRDHRGKWAGAKPKVVPLAVHQELTRRRMSQAARELEENLVKAAETLVALMEGSDVDDSVRLRAATLVIERVMGKVPDKVELKLSRAPWETTMEELMIDRSGIIDVEEVDDEGSDPQEAS